MTTPRQPVGGLGYSSPSPDRPSMIDQIVGSVLSQGDGIPRMDPNILEGAPPWAAAILHMLEGLTVEHEILKLALLRRRIITDHELTEARAMVSQQMEVAMRGAVEAVGRQVAQRVGQPDDPRRSPT
jgi:hypothetical protein